MAAPELNRVWRIKNPALNHPHSGQPVAYHLYPAHGPCLLAQPDSAVARRALFTTRSLWVTPYEEGQLYPAGKYVFQSQRDSGLAQWTKHDRSLLGADPVLWYTFGVTHFVRPEDYPVMPCDQIGFALKPVGFFSPTQHWMCHQRSHSMPGLLVAVVVVVAAAAAAAALPALCAAHLLVVC